MKKLKKLL